MGTVIGIVGLALLVAGGYGVFASLRADPDDPDAVRQWWVVGVNVAAVVVGVALAVVGFVAS